MPVTNFKVIVIGAGPAGLTAAHALTLAGIDFVVLERRETIAPDSGASLVLAPTALRVMEQFGLLDKLLSIGGEISRTKMFDINGNLLGDSTDIADMKKKQVIQRVSPRVDRSSISTNEDTCHSHGSSPVAFHRAELIQTIYDGLTDAVKLKFLMKQRINNMETDGNGVRVFCADGSVHEGSVVIGADGVHSQTRRLMRNLAVTAEPQVAWDAEHPFSSEYRCMWCSFPRPTVQGNSFETQHKDRSVMYISGHERAWIFLYEKLPEKTNMRADYTDKDVEEFADRFADFPITETLKVKDAFAERLTAGMANLEEGVVKNWYYGRLVLVGDACQ